MTTARRSACTARSAFLCPCATRDAVESTKETPTMNRKKGKIKSVMVHPFHSAWRNGAKAWSLPGLLTRIMPRIVIPRNTSRDTIRVDALGATATPTLVDAIGSPLPDQSTLTAIVAGEGPLASARRVAPNSKGVTRPNRIACCIAISPLHPSVVPRHFADRFYLPELKIIDTPMGLLGRAHEFAVGEINNVHKPVVIRFLITRA